MTRQNINTGTTANDGTGDTLRTGANKINDNFRELYTAFGGDSATLAGIVNITPSGVVFNGVTYKTYVNATEGVTDHNINFPAASGNIVLDTASQILTNKTLTSPILTTPKINDTSATHTYNLAVNELAANRTITLPLLTSNDTFTFNAAAQTLTNKTLAAPTINNPIVQGSLKDSSGNEFITFSSTASAVNGLSIINAATGNGPTLAATGGDTNVNLNVGGKGNGVVYLSTGHGYDENTITTTGQAINLNKSLTLFNSAGAIAASLPDGRQVGEFHYFLNEGAGAVTITPTNFAQGTSFTLRSDAAMGAMWSGDNWHLNTGKIFDSSDTDAVVFVTP